MKGYVKNFVNSYRINVPMSASAFLIPGKISGLFALFNFAEELYPRYTRHSRTW
jgi:hypothetical protein